MKLVSVYNSFLIILLLINNCTKAQSIKRTHNFVIFYKKDLDHTNLSETDYDFSSVKKLKQHIKEREEREKKYNEMVESADKLFNQEDYENAKYSYTQALLILNRPWPADQLKKITKLAKKVKKKRH